MTAPGQAGTREDPPAADFAVIMGVPEAHRVGGFERQAFRLAAALARRRVAVRAVTHRLKAEPAREGAAARVPLDVLPIEGRRGGRPALACARYLLRRRRIRRRLVVHCHALAPFSFTLAYAAQRLGIPTVLKVATAGDIDRFWGSAFADRPVHRLGPRLRDVLARCGAVVTLNALSEDEARRQLGQLPSRVLSLTNLVELPGEDGDGDDREDRLVPPGGTTGPVAGSTRDPVGLAVAGARARGRRCALMVNRLEARKNTLLLARLWCDLPPEVRDGWRLLIVGSGEEEAALRAHLRERDDASVILLGEQVGHEKWLGAIDLFILASGREGNPNGLMEAAAAGARVLVTDIPGVGDCLPATATGAVFSLGDPGALETAGRERLRACLESIASGAGAAGSLRETGRRLFGPDVVCSRYLWLYDRLLNPGGR